MAIVTICNDFGAQEDKICHCLHFKVMGPDAMILSFLNIEFQGSVFTLLFHFHQEALKFLFALCHKGGVI